MGGVAESVFAVPESPTHDGGAPLCHKLQSAASLPLSTTSSRDRATRRLSGPHAQTIDFGVSGHRVRLSLPSSLDALEGTSSALH